MFKTKLKLESGNQKKNPIWPPGGHFESDIAKIQYASAYGPNQYAREFLI